MTARPARTFAALAVTATSLLLAACSSSGPATQPSIHTNSVAIITATPSAATSASAASGAVTPADETACALVTEQQLTSLLGADPGPGQATSDSSTISCAYIRGVAVTVVVDHGGGRSQFDLFCPNGAPPNNRNVSDVADGACLTIVGGTGPIAAMYILKGQALMSINIQAGLETKITPSALTSLGKIAAGRL
jgi:hypothetical protein